MHFAAAEHLVADHRAASEAAATRGRLRRLLSRRHHAPTTERPDVTSPVALTLASYRTEPAKPARMRTVA
jgi:hypothetical protein